MSGGVDCPQLGSARLVSAGAAESHVERVGGQLGVLVRLVSVAILHACDTLPCQDLLPLRGRPAARGQAAPQQLPLVCPGSPLGQPVGVTHHVPLLGGRRDAVPHVHHAGARVDPQTGHVTPARLSAAALVLGDVELRQSRQLGGVLGEAPERRLDEVEHVQAVVVAGDVEKLGAGEDRGEHIGGDRVDAGQTADGDAAAADGQDDAGAQRAGLAADAARPLLRSRLTTERHLRYPGDEAQSAGRQ